MNMYKASFETEQNYLITIIDNTTTTKNPYKNSVYYKNLKKYIQEKMEILFSPRRIFYYYYIIT